MTRRVVRETQDHQGRGDSSLVGEWPPNTNCLLDWWTGLDLDLTDIDTYGPIDCALLVRLSIAKLDLRSLKKRNRC